MQPHSGRRFATRIVTSPILVALAVAAGLSVGPGLEAVAQHAGHDGHQDSAAMPSPHDHHAGHAPAASDTPATSDFKAAHADMMRGMAVPYTGDPDADFRIQMIPHHQGAIDMAQVALRHAKDAWTRQLAEAIIVEQQREIVEMQAWLARRGIAAPQPAQPQHIITASSFRQHEEEAGTRGEARGQSWAPGGGAPASR